MKEPKKQYATIAQICKHYPFRRATLYAWAGKNGNKSFRERCVKKIGRMVLIDVEAFEKFIDEEGK